MLRQYLRRAATRLHIVTSPLIAGLSADKPFEPLHNFKPTSILISMTYPRALAIATFMFEIFASSAQSDRQRQPVTRPNFSGTWKLNLQRSGPIMPRGLQALTVVIDHRGPSITSRETRVVSGKVTSTKDGTETIDGIEHVTHPEPGSTVRQRQTWSGATLLKHWQKTVKDTTYISDIKQTLSENGKVLIMSEHYREPGMERIRDWVFEKQ